MAEEAKIRVVIDPTRARQQLARLKKGAKRSASVGDDKDEALEKQLNRKQREFLADTQKARGALRASLGAAERGPTGTATFAALAGGRLAARSLAQKSPGFIRGVGKVAGVAGIVVGAAELGRVISPVIEETIVQIIQSQENFLGRALTERVQEIARDFFGFQRGIEQELRADFVTTFKTGQLFAQVGEAYAGLGIAVPDTDEFANIGRGIFSSIRAQEKLGLEFAEARTRQSTRNVIQALLAGLGQR